MSAEEFSEEEFRAIRSLRERLSDLAVDGSVAGAYLAEDSTVWRYVLAKSQDEDSEAESEAMFRRSIRWREDMQLAALCQEWSEIEKESLPISNHTSWRTARARMGKSCFYGGILKGRSVGGGPVLVERLGSVDLPGLYGDEYAFDCTTKSYITHLEAAWNVVRATGGKTRGIIIIDISGAGLGMLGYISVIKRIVSAGVLMYPEINERVTIVNAGWFMSSLWAAVKPFLPKRTEGKIRIINCEYESIIHPDMQGGADELPRFLGGRLGDLDHGVCPAMSVDKAYGAIVDDICFGRAEYPDSKEFLQAALQHAQNQGSSDTHADRVKLIKSQLDKYYDDVTTPT